MNSPDRPVVADSKQQVYAQFDLDEEWDSLTVTAVFTPVYGTKSYEKLLRAEHIEVPPEALKAPGFRVSLHGVGNKGEHRLPTVRMDKPVTVYLAGELIGLSPEENSPELWEQVLAAIGDLSKLDTQNKDSVVAAINEALRSSGGASPEAIKQAVAEYLKANPADSVTKEAVEEALGYTPVNGEGGTVGQYARSDGEGGIRWDDLPVFEGDYEWTPAEDGSESEGTVSAESITSALGYTPADAEDVKRLEDNKLDNTGLSKAINTALAQAKESGEFDGTNGVSATHKWDGTVLTVASASGTSSADLKGDPGAGGTSITVESVSESTEDGGNNVVTFSDGKTVTIKNGRKGDAFTYDDFTEEQLTELKPVKGTDYFTEADQEAIVQQVIAALGAPVFGRVDADNNIILTGVLTEGTYTLKYENADGEVAEVGSIEVGVEIFNMIPNSIDENNQPYNNGKGWKDGYRLNSSGVETPQDDIQVTGYIPVSRGDTLYLKNINIEPDATGGQWAYTYIGLYDADFNPIVSYRFNQPASYQHTHTVNDAGYVNTIRINDTASSSIKYFRICARGITDDTMITVNQPIQ